MLFGHDDIQLGLIDVLHFNENGSVSIRTRSRPFCALSIRLRGDAHIEMGSRRIHIVKHDIALFPANSPYLRRAENDEMIVFHFRVENYAVHELELLHDFKYDELLPLFKSALDEWDRREPGYRYRASALLYQVFSVIRRGVGKESDSLSQPISDAVSFISENYSDPQLSVSRLAAKAHMSEAWFREQFRKDMGVTPKRYITDLRLERAQSLLGLGFESVASAAVKVGFNDPKNFSAAFKKKFGYPPSELSNEP